MKHISLFILFFSLIYAQEASVTQLFNVQTTKVQKSVHAKNITSYGYIQADQARVYDVAPRYSGYVEVLYADTLYKTVSKGENLAKVYSPEVLKAKDEYRNTLNYSGSKASMLASAKAKLALLDVDHEEKSDPFTFIKAPADGVIFVKNLNNRSAFNAKAKLFEIVNLEKVWAEIRIHQHQRALLEKMEHFTLRTPAYEQSFEASKELLYPKLDPKEESFTLRLSVENKEKLLSPGMYVTLTMQMQEQSYLSLPASAVIRKNGHHYVFMKGEYEGEYEPKAVDVEFLAPDLYNIKSGLSEGDEVVNNALFMIDSDAQVNSLY
ncbi:MAG: efflux RND transporter periplasmic adaptor subunit [Helicobacteraceae bacterium]|nr:efflux RND transporter periplasmic adaptor subunit [Helicobacteraceae bacterium]